jgi:amino acid transporter
MSVTGQSSSVSNVSLALARNRLGVPAIVFFTMSAAAPLMVIAGATTTAFAVTGVTGIPVAFIAMAVLLALFSTGYVAMARQITNAGAFYTYVARGLGRTPGVAAAFVAVLAYNMLQIALYGVFGELARTVLETEFGWNVPWWLCALVAWAIVAVLGVLRVDLNSKVLAVLLTLEVALLLVYDTGNLANPAGGSLSFDTLAPGNLFVAGVGAALVLAVAAFTGFEGAVIFSEEAKDPRRTVPVATYATIAIVAVLYAVSSWAMSVATGPDQVVAQSQEQSIGLLFGLAGQHLGEAAARIGFALFVTSVFAALLSFHNAVSRYLFALGREGVLPRALGRTSRRTGAPLMGSIAQSGLAIVVILAYVLLDLDPLVHLFFWVGMTGAFGVLLLIAATSVSVIGYFGRSPGDEPAWRRIIAPALAAVGLIVTIVLALANYPTLLGAGASGAIVWILPGLYVAAVVLGLAWGAYLRAGRRRVYDGIGLGANAVTGRFTPETETAASALQRTGVA